MAAVFSSCSRIDSCDAARRDTDLTGISILTDPAPFGRYAFTESVKTILRAVKRGLRPPPHHHLQDNRYRGHFAVTRSLVEGLRKIGHPHNYNPSRRGELHENLIVLSGISTLRQGISLKRRGAVRYLLAGPNIICRPSDKGAILASREVDICITPSDWVSRFYEIDCPALQGRCRSWAAGVDTDYWKPIGQRDPKLFVLYRKNNEGVSFDLVPYAGEVEGLGCRVQCMDYGCYDHAGYLKLLQKASLIVGFVPHESQGIAWAEAWAADVPTLMMQGIN